MNAHAINTSHITALLLGAAFLVASFVPLTAEAASSKPSCTLTVTTDAGKTTIKKEDDVSVAKGEKIKIVWKGKNATSAELNDEEIEVSDSETFEVTETTTYDFTFTKGAKDVTCSVTATIAEAGIDSVSAAVKPSIKGTADGMKKVRVAIYKEGSSKPVFEKKTVPVKKGKWSTKSSKKLSEGEEYEVRLYAQKGSEILDSVTFTAGDEKQSDDKKALKDSKGTLSVSMIPLGMSGTASAGKAFSAALIEVRNKGAEDVTVTGFGVRQRGSANTNSIATLYTIDNKGVASASKNASFKSGVAVAPADAVIPAGGVKLFTVKATLGSGATIGSTVILDIVSVESNAKSTSGSFPIKGNVMTVI